MKKLNYLLLGAAGLILASCSNEDVFTPAAGDTATVTLQLSAPQIQSRTYSDGMKAQKLIYAVYENTTDGIKKVIDITEEVEEAKKSVTMVDGKATVTLQLANGHSYNVLLWAANENAPYSVSFQDNGATMTATYGTSVTANDDNLDAFYKYEKLDPINGDMQLEVKLIRPFAQINVGTNDYDAYEKTSSSTLTNSSITVKGAYTTLNLIDGSVSVPEEVTFNKAAIPNHKPDTQGYEPFPKDGGYEYLAMAYVLVDEKENHEVTFSYYEGDKETPRTVSQVPLQRNYRTNIYGALLTSTYDLQVEILPGFVLPDYDKEATIPWDGTLRKPVPDSEGNYSISDPAELAWLASQDDDYDGVDIKLEKNIDLGDKEFPSFAKGSKRNGKEVVGKSFKGNFDGQGHTISNFTITGSGDPDEAVGFFASIEGNMDHNPERSVIIKDIVFENVNIDAPAAEQVGAAIGISHGWAQVENIKVMSGKIKGKNGVGGIMGRMIIGGFVTDCENHADIEAVGYNAGGIVGAAYYLGMGYYEDEGGNHFPVYMSLSGHKNYGKISGTYAVGGIIGLSCASVSNSENYGEVIGQNASVGGIVGEQKATGSVSGNTNYANVTGGEATTNSYGTGGIVGWVRYVEISNDYAYKSAIEVTYNTNEGGVITGDIGVGGIVGMWYKDGLVKGNVNKATTITASNRFVAGIVGAMQWIESGSDGSEIVYDLDDDLNPWHTYTDKLVVGLNNSTTEYENITGACKASLIYVNDQEHTLILDDNLIENQIN